MKEMIANSGSLLVDLDGTAGYGTAFLEEAFGGLVRNGILPEQLMGSLILKSTEEDYLIPEIWSYINGAERCTTCR